MKSLKLFLSFILVLSIFACKPPVTFKEAQPNNTNNLSSFPQRLQGKYTSVFDSTTLLISKNLIERIYNFDYKIHINDLDSTSRLSGDSIIDLKTNEKKYARREGDSLITHIYMSDTLFSMNDDHVLRKLKGYYFINKRRENEQWEVKKIQLSKGQLIISGISAEEDIENLKSISESSQDTIAPYNLKPTKKQFKQYVKNNGFTDSETFVKQK